MMISGRNSLGSALGPVVTGSVVRIDAAAAVRVISIFIVAIPTQQVRNQRNWTAGTCSPKPASGIDLDECLSRLKSLLSGAAEHTSSIYHPRSIWHALC